MANPVGSASVPLSIFGSLNLELSPADLPEGASPANNDVVYLPGSVGTRPGLSKQFVLPLSALGPPSYEKSFITPNGTIKNLYMTKGDGKLWVEDVTNSPGTVTLLFQSAGATYASSCTASGREYIALSDGVHGIDIPLIYDGTNLTRFTQDGPGAPLVTSLALAPSTMAVAGAPATTGITSITPGNLITVGYPPNQFQMYTSLLMVVGSTAGITVGTQVTVSGNTNSDFNRSWVASQIVDATHLQVSCGFRFPEAVGTGGLLTIGANVTLIRSNNTVTCVTTTPHNLQVGYQAQIQGAGTTTVGTSISNLVINNEELPGLATMTMSSAHGLLPGNIVNIQGVTGTTVGTGIANIAYGGGVVTVTTSASHGLSIGSEVLVAAVTNVAVNGQWTVASVPSLTTFTFLYASSQAPYTAADTGTVKYIWPLASTDPELNYFTVQTAPSTTTFTVGISYTDGTWTGGTVTFAWDGFFYVTKVLSTTSFQYQQYGPNATTTNVGTVTPYGQAAPGIHQCRMSYLLADGSITVPSPPVSFVANGGQYISITQAATGPSNVISRIFQFTGAGGAYFFYLPVPAQVNGVTVSTSTQLNDNTSTAVLLDFSDITLYRGTAVSIPGNDLAAQVVLDPTAGMFTYASRMMTWAGRNKVNNLINIGFDGGTAPTSNVPSGWQPGYGATVSVGGALVSGRVAGGQWQITSTGPDAWGAISQSAYLDAYGAPIFQPGQNYSIRFLASSSTLVYTGTANLRIRIQSASASYTNDVSIPVNALTATPTYYTLNFPLPIPTTVPSDLQFIVQMDGTTMNTVIFVIDELCPFLTVQPYIDNEAWISYAENLTAFDGNTGIIGSADDTSPIRNWGTIRNTLYLVTGTGLHETQDNGQTEPSSWGINDVADNCGAFSIASIARNPQGIGSAGKDWMMWNGPDGAQIFLGQKPWKVSQEIQSLWDQVPPANAFQCWTKNFEVSKRCYFGMPDTNGNMYISVLDYRNIDSSMIPENPPIHIAFTGKMIVSDLTRKWTTWTIPAWSGEVIYRAGVSYPQIAFGCLTPTNGANVYTLDTSRLHDDDFGTIPASYTTYFFVSHDQEQALQVGSNRHIYTMAQAFIIGTGTWTLTPYAASLSNPQPAYGPWPLSNPQNFDIDFGMNVLTTRCAFKLQAQPIAPSLDAYFNTGKLVIQMAVDPNARVRGSVSGSS